MKCFVILPVVLCGCETGSVTLRDENRLIVFEREQGAEGGRGNRGSGGNRGSVGNGRV